MQITIYEYSPLQLSDGLRHCVDLSLTYIPDLGDDTNTISIFFINILKHC